MPNVELTEESLLCFRLRTPPDAKLFRDGYILTDWHRLGSDSNAEWVRHAYDVDGFEGLHRDAFQVGRVHWASEVGCWRWQAFLSPGARADFSRKESLRGMTPRQAMTFVDSFLELYVLFQKDYRRKISGENIIEPYALPVLHPLREFRLTSWQRRGRGRRDAYVDRFVRVWVHTPASLEQVSSAHQTGLLVQRVQGSRAAEGIGAQITLHDDGKAHWFVRAGRHRVEGGASGLARAFLVVATELDFFTRPAESPFAKHQPAIVKDPV